MRLVSVVFVLAALVAGCSTAQDALEERLGTSVEEVRGRADELLGQGRDVAGRFEWCTGAAQLAQAVVAGDVEQARVEAEALRGDAPEGLGEDLRTIAEAAARAQVGDPRGLMDDTVQDAARDVYAYAVELCGLADGTG